jgi:endonuclease/exonuclease/phosphatase family metal-dependent hydrolase
MNLTITTFNLENLFARYATIDDPMEHNNPRIVMTGVTSIDYEGNALSAATTAIQRNNTARAILDSKPDILAVQEVENLWTLRLFNDRYLSGYFGQLILIEGNDGRGIDVGLCIKKGLKASISGMRTHVEDLDPNRKDKSVTSVRRYYNDSTNELTVSNALFSRDCLEVDIDVGTTSTTALTFLVNHFKSQSDTQKVDDTLRAAQAAKVVEYVKAAQAKGRKTIVLGDFNEDFTKKPSSLQSLQDLIAGNVLVDPFGSDADADRWTHYYDAASQVSRLDYILVDASLKVSSRAVLRKGISLQCSVAGDRYPTVGYVDSEASDHCPVSVTLTLPD